METWLWHRFRCYHWRNRYVKILHWPGIVYQAQFRNTTAQGCVRARVGEDVATSSQSSWPSPPWTPTRCRTTWLTRLQYFRQRFLHWWICCGNLQIRRGPNRKSQAYPSAARCFSTDLSNPEAVQRYIHFFSGVLIFAVCIDYTHSIHWTTRMDLIHYSGLMHISCINSSTNMCFSKTTLMYIHQNTKSTPFEVLQLFYVRQMAIIVMLNFILNFWFNFNQNQYHMVACPQSSPRPPGVLCLSSVSDSWVVCLDGPVGHQARQKWDWDS
jgi:hypothetical protein